MAAPGRQIPVSHSPWQAFVVGLTRPSLAALLGTVLVMLAAFGACLIFLKPRYMAKTEPGYFMAGPWDEYAYQTVQTLQLRENPPRQWSVLLLGDSSLREGISSIEELESELAEATDQQVRVIVVTAGGMSQWDAVCVTDLLKDRLRGVIVAEISPHHLGLQKPSWTEGPGQRPVTRLALDSRALLQECRRAQIQRPRRFSNYFLNHYGFFLARTAAVTNVVRGPFQLPLHGEIKPDWTRKQWNKNIPRIYNWERMYMRNHDRNLGLYQRMVRRMSNDPDTRVVLLEAFENPRVRENRPKLDRPARFAQYDEDVAGLVKKTQVAYWNMRDEANLRAEDFRDYTHMSKPEARQRVTKALARHLAEQLKPLMAKERKS